MRSGWPDAAAPLDSVHDRRETTDLTNMTRSFDTSLTPDVLDKLFAAAFRTHYRGRLLCKSPYDLGIYMQLLEELKPVTVIEIGAQSGASALWFADAISAAGRQPRIVSIDLFPPNDLSDERIEFIPGNALELDAVLTPALLAELPRPWLVSEDSAHFFSTTLAVLDFFEQKLERDEALVVEDGIVASLPGPAFERYEDGPNRAVAAFLQRTEGRYRIDDRLCDFYGYNATFNPNGWLRRTGK